AHPNGMTATMTEPDPNLPETEAGRSDLVSREEPDRVPEPLQAQEPGRAPEPPPRHEPLRREEEDPFNDEVNNRYEEIKRGSTHISELQQMNMPQLLKIAKEEGLTDITGLKKQDLIF